MLREMTVKSYIELLTSDAPAPGGGSASALCGSQGAGLVAMVAGLTVGKPKYAEFEELCQSAIKEATVIKDKLVEQIDLDTEAFNKVSAAFKLPKATPEEKAARKAAIAQANYEAALVPMETMELAFAALGICRSIYKKSNPNSASDLGVAALNLDCCIKGAWLNVLINISGMAENEDILRLKNRGAEICEKGSAIAAEIFSGMTADMLA